MTHKNVTTILASLVYIIEKVKSINVVFVTTLSCLRLIFFFFCLFVFFFFCLCLLQCGLGVSDSDMHMSYLPLAHMYERLAQVGKALTTATTKQTSFMARNIGLARADGTANQNKNMSHHTFSYRDFIMKTDLKSRLPP